MTARTAILFLALVCGTSSLGWGDTCVVGNSLAAYEAAGSCTVGNLTYSNFQYTGTGTAADAITAGEVTVVPAIGELILKASWDVDAGQSLTSDISYVVSGVDAVITGLELTMKGWGFLEGGALSITDTWTGETDPNATRFAQFGGLSVTYNPTFNPLSSFTITEDISLTGNNGAASMSYIAADWTTASTPVPEPAPALLVGIALASLEILIHLRHACRT